MKSASECLLIVKVLCAQAGKPKVLRIDNGTEYTGETFADFCIQKGYKKKVHCSIFVRLIKMVFVNVIGALQSRWRGACSKMQTFKTKFWARALDIAFYITNRCLTLSLPNRETPFEMFFGKNPDLCNVRVSACLAYKFIGTHQDKLSPKATKYLFVG